MIRQAIYIVLILLLTASSIQAKAKEEAMTASVDDAVVGLAIPSQEAGSWHYLAGMRVKAGAVVPEGITIYDVPAGSYAKVETTVDEMEYAYFTIYRNWLPDSPYEKSMELPAIDILSQDGDSVTICVPIKRKN